MFKLIYVFVTISTSKYFFPLKRNECIKSSRCKDVNKIPRHPEVAARRLSRQRKGRGWGSLAAASSTSPFRAIGCCPDIRDPILSLSHRPGGQLGRNLEKGSFLGGCSSYHGRSYSPLFSHRSILEGPTKNDSLKKRKLHFRKGQLAVTNKWDMRCVLPLKQFLRSVSRLSQCWLNIWFIFTVLQQQRFEQIMWIYIRCFSGNSEQVF